MDILGRFGEKFYRPDFPLTPYVFVEKFIKTRERKQIRIKEKKYQIAKVNFQLFFNLYLYPLSKFNFRFCFRSESVEEKRLRASK